MRNSGMYEGNLINSCNLKNEANSRRPGVMCRQVIMFEVMDFDLMSVADTCWEKHEH